MEFYYLNAAILPLLATVFIPDAIRDSKTGKYLGLFNRSMAIYFMAILAMQLFISLQYREFGWRALEITVSTTLLVFIGAMIFVKYTNKKRYGVEIRFSKWW